MCRIFFFFALLPQFSSFHYMNGWCQHQSCTDTFGESQLREVKKTIIDLKKKEMLLFSA